MTKLVGLVMTCYDVGWWDDVGWFFLRLKFLRFFCVRKGSLHGCSIHEVPLRPVQLTAMCRLCSGFVHGKLRDWEPQEGLKPRNKNILGHVRIPSYFRVLRWYMVVHDHFSSISIGALRGWVSQEKLFFLEIKQAGCPLA